VFSRIGLFCISVLLSGAVLAQSQTPDAARNYFEHGTKHYKQGDFDRAIEDFSKAIEISSYLTVSNRGSKIASGRANAFAASSDEAGEIRVINPFTAQALISRSLAFLQKRDFDHALADLNRAIEINPGIAAAYVDRGGARYALRDTQGALTDLNKAIQLDSKLAAAYVNRGAVLIEMGNLNAAFADLD